MVRRMVLGALIAVIAGWVLATTASGSSPHRVFDDWGQRSELTTPTRACTPHGSSSVRSDRWTARRALVLHTSRPVGRLAVCRRIAA
jgi:hypothetical protein